MGAKPVWKEGDGDGVVEANNLIYDAGASHHRCDHRGEWELDPHVPDLLFILGFSLPGLLYLIIGLWSWRKEWLAVRERVLMGPLLVCNVLLIYSVWAYDDVLRASGNGGASDLPFFSYLVVNIVAWGSILPLLAAAVYTIRMGQILILRARHDIVLKAIEQTLGKMRWAYTREEDVIQVPEFKMKIQVNWSEAGGLVGVWRRCRDADRRELLDESILATFRGRPSGNHHPGLLVLGCALLSIGIGLTALLATG